jgi:hypothetical protein
MSENSPKLSKLESPSPSSSSVEVALGDIIQIIAPTNSSINDQIYLIEYIDETKIKLINVATSTRLILTMSSKGGFSDESITGIAILNSPEFPGYARQNNLVKNTWVDIHFGGELPTIITGQITDLEEDMIEIKTYPGEQVFYLDFGYKGIPENIPIEEIRIRSPPSESPLASSTTPLADVASSAAATRLSQEEEIGVAPISISKQPNLPSISPQIPVEEVKTALKEILLDADSIQFGDELESIIQVVELPEEQKRYSIEKQTTDLLNELISEFPNIERTKSVLNNIHSIIERFRQLREEFSTFDANGNATLVKRRSEDYKPLAKTLLSLNQKLFWILPVSKNIRKFYNVDSANPTDFTVTTIEESIERENALTDDYMTNKDSFATYINKMNEYITPYTNPDPEFGFTQYVHANITSILDNLSDFYSSIVKGEQVKRNQFVIQTYNLGLSQIQTRKTKSFGKRVADTTDVLPLTQNDSINITSFISLPEPVMHFSNISLPNTDIMTRANMGQHFVPYWNLLRKNTSITRKSISLEEMEGREGRDKDRDQYDVDDMVQFTSGFMSFFSDEQIDSEEKYRKFVEMLIPNTSLLFEVMNKYITGEITLGNYVAILQPFMIYVRDLTLSQYEVVVSFISQRVSEYRKKIVNAAKEYAPLSTAKYAAKYAGSSALYNLLKDSRQVNFDTDILDIYGMSPENYMNVRDKQANIPGGDAVGARGSSVAMGGLESDKLETTHKRRTYTPKKKSGVGAGAGSVGSLDAGSIFPPISFSNEEILYRLICVDNARLYMNTLSIINEDLITPFDFDQLYGQEKDKFEQDMESKHGANKCKNFVLTKKYIDRDELEEDQGEEIFYDKNYDFTDYAFLKKHEKDRPAYSAEDFETFLVSRYMKKTKLPMQDAKSEVRDMLRGKRNIQDGQYAVLEVTDEEGDRFEYYIRANRKWLKDDTIPNTVTMYDTTYFCNVKSDCFALNKKCMTPELAQDTMKDEVIKQMYDEFDSNFHQSRKQILDTVYRKYNYSIDTIDKLQSIQKYNAYKYNNAQYFTGLDNEIDPTVREKVSPYARIFDLILGQTDYVKRQRNIMRFIQKFTRPAIEESTSMTLSVEVESPYWLYCKDTNTKLVPSFFETIATVFLSQGDIQTTIDTICKERGSISEDGDAWTDKYSGYVIKNIDLDTEEGYDAAGFKLQTREIMEKTLGETLIQSLQDKKLPTFKNPDMQMISGIITTMTKYMAIDLETQRTFIIEQVMNVFLSKIPSEDDFNRKKAAASASGSASVASRQTYKDFKLNTILLLTLSFLVVVIQVNIPSVKTRKTFPGCVRSFVGYPMDGDGDISSIKYIACIAIKIKSSIEPWNTLKGKKEDDIASKIKAYIEKIVVKIPTIDAKILEKREYNKIHVAEELPAEHDIKNWINFLPPLSKLKMSSPSPLSPNFQSDLLEDFKKGSGNQFEKIAVIRAKIIFYSLAIQVMVQKVVDKEKLILTNGANEPIVENACCNADGSVNTIKYFVEQERIIDDYNKQVTLLRNVLDDIIEIQKSSSFYDPENTRTKYPDIPEGFDEQTIYMAFIVYCKFNSDVPIPNSIQHLCHDKPSTENYNPSEESLKVKIDKLKSTGEYTYTPEALQALLQIVNGEHTISFDFNPTEVSYIQRMRDLIKSYQEKHSSEVPEILLTKLTELLDTFNIQISEDTPELRELKNYLSEKNGEMVDAILEFISQYKSLDRKTTKLYKSFLLNITNFKLIGDNVLCPKRDTSTYKGMQFVVNEMRNLIHVFPNIILNGVNNQKVSVHKHWGLSRQHVLDIQTIVKKYYTEIDKYMKDKENSVLATVVTGVMKETNEWFQFALNTPLFARVIKRDVSKVQGQGDVMEMDVEEFEEEEMAEEGDAGGLLSGLFGKAASSRGVPSRREESRKEEREESEAETRGSARQYRKRTSEEDSGGMYSLFNDDLVRRLFTHYFLNVVLKYVKLARTVVVVAQEAQLQEEDESSLVSVLEAQDQQNGVVREVSFVAQEDAELKNMVANLLLVFFKIIMADKTAINVNNKSIKEDITQSKDKEKDIITREFRDMQVAERQVENLMKNLRLGDWNVGATKGLRFYVPETYEQEREQMENEFRRDEEQAKMEKKALKRDKVTVRMRDIYADEEEERLHQDAEIEADLADEYNLQGDDDEYGVEDDGAYNPRDGGEGDD